MGVFMKAKFIISNAIYSGVGMTSKNSLTTQYAEIYLKFH